MSVEEVHPILSTPGCSQLSFLSGRCDLGEVPNSHPNFQIYVELSHFHPNLVNMDVFWQTFLKQRKAQALVDQLIPCIPMFLVLLKILISLPPAVVEWIIIVEFEF